MPRRRASSGKLVSKPLLLFKTAAESTPNLISARWLSKAPHSPPSPISSADSSMELPSFSSSNEPDTTIEAEDCEVLADYTPEYEALKEEAYIGTLGALQGASSSGRDSLSLPHCPFEQLTEQLSDQFLRPRPPSAYDSLSRRLSTISTGSKRRTLRLVRSTPSLTAPAQPIISHPMPLGSARRIRKVPSMSADRPKSRLSSMFAWRP